MSNLKNVELMEQSLSSPVSYVSDHQHQNNVSTFKQSLKFGIPFAVATLAVNANAAMPAIDTADILTYIGLLVAAVATVGSAFLMVYLAAKGIKAIRAAF